MDQLTFKREVLRIRHDRIEIGELLDCVRIICDTKLR